MVKEKVSVIIPSYNSKKYLRETIDSVLAQTYPSIEIILINDGSTDGTEELFPEFEKLGVQCFSQKNSGASVARNLGLKNASGDYIQFLDADDIIYPEKIEKQIKQMEADNADLSFTFWNTFSDDKNKFQEFPFSRINFSNIRSGKDIMHSFGINNWYILIHAWLVKKSLIEKAGYWNPYISNNDDGEYFSRILIWSECVNVVEEALCAVRRNAESTLSVVNTEKKAISAFNSWKLIYSLILSTNDKKLLAYPKRGFYVNFKMSRVQFPTMAKSFAKEFDKINTSFFLSNWKPFWLIKYFGLYRGYQIIDTLLSLKKKFGK